VPKSAAFITECRSAVNRKRPRGVGLGVPAEAPQPLDFRKPQQIKELIAYSSEDGPASLQSIYGLQTHPGVHCVCSPWVQVWLLLRAAMAKQCC
jgi:hypothetical protein